MNQLLEFLKEKRRNGWITVGPYEVYLRHGFHMVNGEITKTLDVANISNQKGETRGKGGFVKLMMAIQDLVQRPEYQHDTLAIYVESVINPKLDSCLISKLQFFQIATVPPSYVWWIPEPMDLGELNEMDAKHPGWNDGPTAEELLSEVESM